MPHTYVSRNCSDSFPNFNKSLRSILLPSYLQRRELQKNDFIASDRPTKISASTPHIRHALYIKRPSHHSQASLVHTVYCSVMSTNYDSLQYKTSSSLLFFRRSRPTPVFARRCNAWPTPELPQGAIQPFSSFIHDRSATRLIINSMAQLQTSLVLKCRQPEQNVTIAKWVLIDVRGFRYVFTQIRWNGDRKISL